MSERSAFRPRPTEHRAPSECPVCGDHLAVTRLGCGSCGTELAGVFAACEFCALDAKDVAMLRVFLGSRGNLRELERHLGVSYPTARQRFNELLVKLGLGAESEPAPESNRGPEVDEVPEVADAGREPELTRDDILARVAAGTLRPDQAAPMLRPPR